MPKKKKEDVKQEIKEEVKKEAPKQVAYITKRRVKDYVEVVYHYTDGSTETKILKWKLQ